MNKPFLIRTFHSVGQGGFTSEVFLPHNDKDRIVFVYDCGSLNKKELSKCLGDFANNYRIIRSVYISHLDCDHCNGLKQLLNETSVEQVYLPLLTPKQKDLTLLLNRAKGSRDSFIEQLIYTPLDAIESISPSTKVYLVREYSSDSEERTRNMSASQEVPSGLDIPLRIGNRDQRAIMWSHRVFNFRSAKRSSLIQKELKARSIVLKANNVEKYWQNPSTKESIKAAYKSIPGSPNTNSMVLCSFPQDSADEEQLIVSEDLSKKRFSLCSGAVYMGDFIATRSKWLELHKAISCFRDDVFIIQVPHHGAKGNWNRKLISDFKHCMNYIVFRGSSRARYPHSAIATQLDKAGRLLHDITEKSSPVKISTYFFIRI